MGPIVAEPARDRRWKTCSNWKPFSGLKLLDVQLPAAFSQ